MIINKQKFNKYMLSCEILNLFYLSIMSLDKRLYKFKVKFKCKDIRDGKEFKFKKNNTVIKIRLLSDGILNYMTATLNGKTIETFKAVELITNYLSLYNSSDNKNLSNDRFFFYA